MVGVGLTQTFETDPFIYIYIAEFWRIRSLVESTARSVRRSRRHGVICVQESQSQDAIEHRSGLTPEYVCHAAQGYWPT